MSNIETSGEVVRGPHEPSMRGNSDIAHDGVKDSVHEEQLRNAERGTEHKNRTLEADTYKGNNTENRNTDSGDDDDE